MDANKAHGEEAMWEQHKNAMCWLEQILEVTSHKTAVVQLLTSYLKNQ